MVKRIEVITAAVPGPTVFLLLLFFTSRQEDYIGESFMKQGTRLNICPLALGGFRKFDKTEDDGIARLCPHELVRQRISFLLCQDSFPILSGRNLCPQCRCLGCRVTNVILTDRSGILKRSVGSFISIRQQLVE